MKRRILVQLPSRRSIAAAATAGALGVLTSACSIMSPQQTNAPYAPADGVQTTIGDLAIRDLVIVGDGSGPAMVSGAAINLGNDPIRVQFTAEQGPTGGGGGGSELELGAREQVVLGNQGLELTDFTAKPGTVVGVMITSSVGGSAVLQVPVLDSIGYYSTITPAPAST